MEFRVLGPMEILCDGRPVATGGGRGKAVLAALLLHANKTVSRSQLIDLVWVNAPDSVGSNLRSYLAKIRKAVHAAGEETSRLVTDPHGFRLVVADGELDLAEFERLAGQGEEAAAAGDPAAATEHFSAALELWRGPALGGVHIESRLAAAVAHLSERRDRVELEGLEARMALGRHAELVGELRGLVAAQPLREHLVVLLMLALYRCGRQKEALAQYRDTRRRLVADLGVEPGNALEETHRRILAADPRLDAPRATGATASTRVVPSQLPADIPAFTGRARELATVREHARGCFETGRAGTVVVTALDGMAGVGKTTLAVHAARQLAADFPDGQLFIDLRGFGGVGPVDPGQALDRLLRSLGVQPEAIPAETDDRAALYRSLLAGRRMLLLLDNAINEAQVRPLLPGDSGCLVIVTSRRHLTALDEAVPVPVDVLGTAEAGALFGDVAGIAADRADARELIAEIVEACGRLPLAVRIAASRLRSRPRWSLEDLRDKLVDGGVRLARLEFGERSVAAAFDMSYEELDAGHARLFRLLSLAPGPDCGVAAARTLIGASPGEDVETLLEDLVDAHLLRSYRPGRYGFHDLLRAYARDLAERIDPPRTRNAVLDGLTDHYLASAAAAGHRLDPLGGDRTPAPPAPTDAPDAHGSALEWFDTEHHALMEVLRRADAAGADGKTLALVRAMEPYFERRGLWAERATAHRLAVAAAERVGDDFARAHCHRNLGRSLVQLGRVDEAGSHFDTAMRLFVDLGDPGGQADVHRGVGWLLANRADYRAAIEHARAALDLYRAAGDRARQAQALNAIGWRHAQLGEYRDALDHCRRGIELFAEVAAETGHGDFQGEAETWDSLGYVHHRLGDHEAALSCFTNAIQLLSANGERYFLSEVLTRTGEVRHDMGDRDLAAENWRRALDLLEQLGHADADRVRERLSTLDEA